jgi:hypothetical protein
MIFVLRHLIHCAIDLRPVPAPIGDRGRIVDVIVVAGNTMVEPSARTLLRVADTRGID